LQKPNTYRMELDKWAYKNGFTKVKDGFVNSQQKYFRRWEIELLKKEYDV
jgi:hypothetical protein